MWVEEAMREVAAAHLFPTNTHILLMDEAELRRRMHAVVASFNEAVSSVPPITAPDGTQKPAVSFLHAFAVKANPLVAVLRIAQRCGLGAETASIGEFQIAERVFLARGDGIGHNSGNIDEKHKARVAAAAAHIGNRSPGGPIVFDSPAKTIEELHYALQRPCYLNADNFTEIVRMVALVDGTIPGFAPLKGKVRAVVGIRINPQSVDSSSNAALATGGKISKFGVALRDPGNKERLIECYETLHDKINLRMVHVHSGSQGLSLDVMVAGVHAMVSEIVDHPKLRGIITTVDIGGGLPVDLVSDDETVTVKEYVSALLAKVPALFRPPADAPPRTIITEFGRAIAAKSGVLISRVEYTKMCGGRQIVLQHIGADLAVRTVWQPEKWPLRVYLYDHHGCIKGGGSAVTAATGGGGEGGNAQKEGGPTLATDSEAFTGALGAAASLPDGLVLTDVAGPCCNSGCTLTRALPLPDNIVPLQDVVVVKDVGGYYHSSFSLYNLRQMPACYLRTTKANTKSNGGRLVCIRGPQPVEDTISLFT